ncbi:MAG: hypothetical protein WCK49_09485 [Myxococcaceae bacterium]
MIAVQKHFEQITGLKFAWENEPREMLQKPYGLLKLGASSMLGNDQIYDNQLVGSREIILQVQVFSRSFKPTENARFYLEKARTSLAYFKAPNLIFDEAHPIVDLDFVFMNRQESRAGFDAVFRMLELQDLSQYSPGYFTQVELKL